MLDETRNALINADGLNDLEEIPLPPEEIVEAVSVASTKKKKKVKTKKKKTIKE